MTLNCWIRCALSPHLETTHDVDCVSFYVSRLTEDESDYLWEKRNYLYDYPQALPRIIQVLTTLLLRVYLIFTYLLIYLSYLVFSSAATK